MRFFNKDTIFVALVLLVSAGLFMSGDPREPGEVTVLARIVNIVDNTETKGAYLKVGGQEVTARILKGPYKGQSISTDNGLVGNLMLDRFVEVGDRAVFILNVEEGRIIDAELVDYDRQSWHLAVFILFAVLLILFARYTGVRAFASFIFTVSVIVRLLIPAILKGYDPLLLCVFMAILVASVTLLLVGGFSIRTTAAIISVTFSMVLTALLVVMGGKGIRLDGMTCEHSLILLFSGYPYLNLDRVFWGAVILGASGAMVDVAIAVSTAVEQVVKANPGLGMVRLIRSGFEVGRAALGTMVTTLLLAYAGSGLFLFLVFNARETHLARILNYNFVSAEIFRTLAGSIGMVMVAPISAVIAGVLYHRIHGIERLS
ncbi:MAG: YibE/F family protein [Deltaproteobacteria bacterium]|nr:YibE/F family protein [Deltaproteobacteria bacterium]MBW2052569.1 YibE/F family protein [Deltaproteobacteria bacterium]MBW2141829.1 YibE/F family protein [Deltaproteobacteria bacterium]MBW2324708.1 YibE/F family protein [Deltaproteobacteria bacterium]